MLEGTADSSGTGQPEVASALSAADPQIDPADEESNSDSDTDSDNFDYEASFCDSNTDSDNFNYEESFCDRYRRKWVCQSATQTENEFKCISRASLFPKSPFPHSLRPAKRNHLSRFQSSGRTPVEVPLYHPPSWTLPALPSALRGSWIN